MSKYNKLIINIVVLSSIVLSAGTALAIWGTPSPSTGYFNNKYDPGTDYTHIIQNASQPNLPGLYPILGSQPKDNPVKPTKQQFIDYIVGKLGGQTQYVNSAYYNGSTLVPATTQDQMGAAFLIQTMRPGNDRSWPTASDIQDWEDRINNVDVSFQIILNDTKTENSGYSTSLNDDAWITSGTSFNALLIKYQGVTYYEIKTNCANAFGDTLPLPSAQPKVRGYKIDTNYSPVGDFSVDTINADGGSDNGQPFNITLNTGDNVTVAPVNSIPKWAVIKYAYTVCNTASAGNDCNAPLTSSPPPNAVTGTSWPIGTAKAGYVYSVWFIYDTVKPAIIKGIKVDKSGNTSGPYSSDIIRANSYSGTVSNSGQPFNLSVSAGNVTITPDNNIANWSVIGYELCDSATPSCTFPSSSSPLTTPFLQSGATASPTLIAGHTYYMWWVYQAGGPPPGCPSLPNPSVSVSLPDQTPSPQTPPPSATTTSNSTYIQYVPQKQTNVTNIQDISIGGNRLLTILNLKSQSYQQAVVDYSPFVKGYPYDSNQARVTYDTYYTKVTWKSASTPSYYTHSYSCPSGTSGPNSNNLCVSNTPTFTTIYCTQGGTWNGINCGTYTSPTPTSYTYSCPSGQALSGSGSSSVCTTSYPAVDHWTCSNSTATWSNGKTCLSKYRIHHYVCPYGGQLVSTTCVVTYQATATPVYGQIAYPSPASVSTPTYALSNPIDTPEAWYDYTIQKSEPNQTIPHTVDATLMMPCYNRSFNVTGVNSSSANISLNSNENPSSAMPSGYTLSVKFSYPAGYPTPTQTPGLRQKMQANLKYSYKFYKNSNPNSPQICSSNNNTFNVTGSLSPGSSSPDPFIIQSIPCAVSVGSAATQLAPGDEVCAIYSVSPTGSLVDVQGNVVTSNGGTVSSGEKCSGHVVNEPYFKVFGGDVSAGSAFATTSSSGASTCSANTAGAGVYGWNTAADPVYGQHYAGSGAQFAVTSPNVILGVASNQNNSNANPAAGGSPNPLGLSFSNTVNNSAPAGQFGGNLTANCITDFYSSKPTSVTGDISGSQNLNGLNGIYTMSGGSTINQSNISSGKHITIYASGDVFISGDITFPGSYATIDQIPSLILIVKGNIYISNNVKTLSGIFIAQPTTSSSTDGYIYDCAAGAGLFVSPNSIYSGCGNQLVVNGSFIANKVSLMRTGITTGSPISSSLRGSITNETNAVTNKNPAEIFNYGPAFWMNLSLPQSTSTGTSSAGYDSIISLPPIL